MERREFLKSAGAAALFVNAPSELVAAAANSKPQIGGEWDQGQVRHLLPTVSDTEMLIKASFFEPQKYPPVLRVDSITVSGKMTDTQGEFWQFHVRNLKPGRTYQLNLKSHRGAHLCEPWELATFPDKNASPDQFRALFISCVGGHEAMGFLTPEVRNRLLKRALSFKPQATIVNGDHVYWDLLSPVTSKRDYGGSTEKAFKIAGQFDRAGVVLGGDNETVLKKAVGPQLTPIYKADFRSTPVFFLQDDHDYFDNDDATDEIVTFPPSYFMMQLARSTQSMYYPEFLADTSRPKGLPFSYAADRPVGVSESFGTVRYGKLAEIVLYDVRRTATLAGPSAVYVDTNVEKWLIDRTQSNEVQNLVHCPSNPPGWSLGKWGEWYPDVLLAEEKKLTTAIPKPYWQSGWLKQHDRLMTSLSSNKSRTPLVISGDMHSIALGSMMRSGSNDFSSNPVNVALSGTGGTYRGGWPSSGRRKTPAMTSGVLDFKEEIKPIEQHGFTLVDFTKDKMVLSFFKWDVDTQTIGDIDNLQPFHVKQLPRA
jgi:hypothetical protein